MPKNHRVEVLCTADELERIRNNAHAKGFPTVSAFVRDFALRSPLTTEERIAEIHQAIIKQGIEKIADSYAPKYKQNPNYGPNPLKEPGFEGHQGFYAPEYH